MATPGDIPAETPPDEEVKSKRPPGDAFRQQRLKAWQPILTAGTVIPTFFVLGIAFIPIGIGLFISSENVQEHIVDYTDCKNDKGRQCSDVITIDNATSCLCKKKFYIDKDFKSDVFMYYGLTNFYQNHRRYVKSRDDNQLLGKLSPDVEKDCEPYDYFGGAKDKGGIPIAPCGAIANSLFSDTLEVVWLQPLNVTPVPILKTGIAWPSDKNNKFKNPSNMDDFKKFHAPPNWHENVTELDPKHPDNNGFVNEGFIVWMRTAAFPTFRKLYGRVDHSKQFFINVLPKGNYTLIVNYTYPVKSFGGRKRMILSNTSWLGGKNNFLGVAYIVVGSMCLLLGVMFLVLHIKFGKSAQEMVDITRRTAYQ